jgi:hypothetical protein
MSGRLLPSAEGRISRHPRTPFLDGFRLADIWELVASQARRQAEKLAEGVLVILRSGLCFVSFVNLWFTKRKSVKLALGLKMVYFVNHG